MRDFLLSRQPYWLGVLGNAVIAFSATFAGVLASFGLENRRRRQAERIAFGRLVESVLIESANNQAVLRNIAEPVSAGKIVASDLRTESLHAALLSPLTVKYAPYSLLNAMSIISTWLATFANVLASQRAGGGLGRGLTEHGVEDLKIRAESCQKLIDNVLQPEIEALPETFRTHVVWDS